MPSMGVEGVTGRGAEETPTDRRSAESCLSTPLYARGRPGNSMQNVGFRSLRILGSFDMPSSSYTLGSVDFSCRVEGIQYVLAGAMGLRRPRKDPFFVRGAEHPLGLSLRRPVWATCRVILRVSSQPPLRAIARCALGGSYVITSSEER
jgi:hypothetical protein